MPAATIGHRGSASLGAADTPAAVTALRAEGEQRSRTGSNSPLIVSGYTSPRTDDALETPIYAVLDERSSTNFADCNAAASATCRSRRHTASSSGTSGGSC